MASTSRIVTRTPVSADALFDASLSIDEHVASMAGSGERAVDGVTSGTIGLGQSVTWRARHFGVWFRMTSKVTALDRPFRFVDEQVRGPFRSFRHVHTFPSREGDTVMVDELTIASPVLGAIAERLVLVPYLRRLIRARNRHLLRRLGHLPSTDPAREVWSPHDPLGYRRFEASSLIGRGDEVWARAVRDVLHWRVKTRSGFRVDGSGPVAIGQRPTITVRVAALTVREPVEVVAVVEEPDRAGFAYRARPGHPVRGEEAFIVHRRGDEVFLTIRSLTAPARRQPWRALYPVLRVAQHVVRRRYARALR